MTPAPLLAALLVLSPPADDRTVRDSAPSAPAADPANAPPNVVFIMCDDLGWGDLGCFGQTTIKTPRLDALAAQGARLTAHYSGFPVWPRPGAV